MAVPWLHAHSSMGLMVLGDTVNEVPPLKMLSGSDVAHLDGILDPRRHGRLYVTLRLMMNVIKWKVRLSGRWTDEYTLESVNGMFQTVANISSLKQVIIRDTDDALNI
jgi:hypothetical protein